MTVTTHLDPLDEVAVISGEPEPKWSLKACSSWLAGQEFAIRSKQNADVVKIGRGSHCDIIFPGTHLSREHVELRIEHGQIYVKDLNSINGTFINEIRVTEGIVRPGDQLRLDVYGFRVEGPKIAETADILVKDRSNATKLRSDYRPSSITPEETLLEKQWITKPTSLGNRIEEKQPQLDKPSTPSWLISSVLILAIAAAGSYIVINYF